MLKKQKTLLNSADLFINQDLKSTPVLKDGFKVVYSFSISSTLRFTNAVSAAPESIFCESNAKSKA